MDQNSQTLTDMMRSVLAYTLAPANSATTDSVPEFKDNIGSLEIKVSDIDKLIGPQGSDITGYSEKRHLLRASLAAVSFGIIKPSVAYCRSIQDTGLLKKINFNLSDLQRFDFTKIGQQMQTIHDLLKAIGAPLVPFGVTVAGLAKMQTAITNYNDFVTVPRNTVANRKKETKELKKLVKEGNDIVRFMLDPIAVNFQESAPSYYEGYLTNRKLVPYGKKHTQLRCYIVTELNEPIQFAKVSIEGTDLFAQTDEKGYCLIDLVPFGFHNITIQTGSNIKTEGPFRFYKGQALRKTFIAVPDFASAPQKTAAKVIVEK